MNYLTDSSTNSQTSKSVISYADVPDINYTMKIDFDEAVRYLGFGAVPPDKKTLEAVRSCISELEHTATPRHALRRFPIDRSHAGTLFAGGVEMKGNDIAEKLLLCSELFFLCVTVGIEADTLIERYVHTHISRAVVMQAVAAAAVEGCCEEIRKQLELSIKHEGLFLGPRYGPGYGDFPLDTQSLILSALNAESAAGVVMAEGGMMMPEKTLTAVFGISKSHKVCREAGCKSCKNLDCPFRKAQYR